MKKFKVAFDSTMWHDFTAIALYRIDHFGHSETEARTYVKQLQDTIKRKLTTSPMRWPISRQEPLHELNMRICFGKSLSPFLVIFKVLEKRKTVMVYRIVWERSDYAKLFAMDSGT